MNDAELDMILNGADTNWLFDPEEDEGLDLETFDGDIPDELEEDIPDEFWDDMPDLPEITHEDKKVDWQKEGRIISSLSDLKYIEYNNLQAEHIDLKDTLDALDLPGKVVLERCAYVNLGDKFFLITPDYLRHGFLIREVEMQKLPELVYQLLCF